ncbi:4'-phosphopantetheinyl transferase [Paraburkholderia sp. GAS41]|uniref:4'-phosphopantetheinyl transferase family protein n=1 Tax=Paraburkholderia sp. GAS41 TaxID=3035134 RepID=UPI003D1F018B
MRGNDIDLAARIPSNGRWPDDVTLWHVDMRDVAALEDTIHLNLDVAERARADRYVRRDDRRRFITTRSTLRKLLGARLGVPPNELLFVANERGRLELPDHPELSFNVSHSGNAALLAISDRRVVGVDLELRDPSLHWRELAALVCTGGEQQVLQDAPEQMQSELFMRYWVAKEAILKAMGIGIAEDLLNLIVDPTSQGVQQPVVKETSALVNAHMLRFHWLFDVDEHPACIAYGPSRNN